MKNVEIVICLQEAEKRTKIFFFFRKIQDALEKQNKESYKKREEEKRKVDEATEKAKELMRVKKTFFCDGLFTGLNCPIKLIVII